MNKIHMGVDFGCEIRCRRQYIDDPPYQKTHDWNKVTCKWCLRTRDKPDHSKD